MGVNNVQNGITIEKSAREQGIDRMLKQSGFTNINYDYLNSMDNSIVKSAQAAKNAERIAKGMSGVGNVGYGTDPNNMEPTADGVGTTAALRRESLADYVRNATYASPNFIFYSKMRNNVYESHQTVEQYDIFDHHSAVGHGLTNREGAISDPTNPHITRKLVPIKYISSTNTMTMQARMVSSVADPVDIYNEDAITTLISQIEWECYYGDADLSASAEEKNGTEFDGLIKLIPEANVIDARGEALTPNQLMTGALKITASMGVPSDVFMPMGVKAKFVQNVQDSGLLSQVSVRDANQDAYNYGFNIDSYTVPGSGVKVSLNGSNVMNTVEQYDPAAIGTAGDALTPKVTAKVTDHPDTEPEKQGKFRKDHEVGTTLEYKFVSSIGTELSTATDVAVAVTAPTQTVDFDIHVKATSTNIPDFITVYRKAENGFFWAIKRIAMREADADGNMTWSDNNDRIAGTADVFMGDMSREVIGLYELLPIDVLPLAQFSATYYWTYLWFGALALFVPQRWVRIKNVDMVAAQYVH